MTRAHLLIFLTLALSPAIEAQTRAGMVYGELYGGLYFPDSGPLDDGSVWGVRTGYRWDALAVELSADRFEGTVSTGRLSFDARFTAVALSGVWIPNPGGRPEILLTAGFGQADVDRDGTGSSLGNRPAEDSAFLRAGAGLSFALRGRLYLRPQAEARWFDHGDGPVDLAVTVAAGWRF
jgi:hypothetical protein